MPDDFVRNRPPSYGEFAESPPPPEYGLAGTAYAKARDAAEKANQARAWQDLNAAVPEGRIFAPGSTPIADVDKETRPETADGKNYNERPR